MSKNLKPTELHGSQIPESSVCCQRTGQSLKRFGGVVSITLVHHPDVDNESNVQIASRPLKLSPFEERSEIARFLYVCSPDGQCAFQQQFSQWISERMPTSHKKISLPEQARQQTFSQFKLLVAFFAFKPLYFLHLFNQRKKHDRLGGSFSRCVGDSHVVCFSCLIGRKGDSRGISRNPYYRSETLMSFVPAILQP